MSQDSAKTDTQSYTDRLVFEQSKGIRKYIDVQIPYRWNLRRLDLGFTLDVGCGIGRNLLNISGNGVGVDHNQHSVDLARKSGLKAFTVSEFLTTPFANAETFDSILVSHVLEHMTQDEAVKLLLDYKKYLKCHGKVVVICPQEKGYASDATHVEFLDFKKLEEILIRSGFSVQKSYSFPFPRFIGKIFLYNEFVMVGTLA